MTHGEIDGGAPLDKTRNNVIDVADRIGIIHPKILHDTLGSLTVAVPQFALGVPVTAEHDHLPLTTTGYEYKNTVRLLEACEVKEIAVLAERVFRIAAASDFTRRRNNGNAVWRHFSHQPLSPRCKL